MQLEIRLPSLAESMTDGTLTTWFKKEGDRVTTGEAIAQIETEKSNVDLEAPEAGVLRRILVPAGTEKVKVGDVLALLETGSGEGTGDHSNPVVTNLASSSVVGVTARASGRSDPASPPVIEPMAPRSSEAVSGGQDFVNATPLARRMATVVRLDLTEVKGTGQSGRVGKVDVERILRERQGVPAVYVAPAAPPVAARPSAPASEPAVQATARFEERPLSAMRRVTAARLLQAKQTVPHFYLRIECAADAMLDLRSRANAGSSDLKLTVTDFIVRAAALALHKVPLANSTWADNVIRVYKTVDIAVAVATPTGLITPIVREADRKGLATISRELKELAEQARAGQLRPEEYTGGTFTVSNLGMYGVESLYAIVNPPQGGILGVGAVQQRPVVRGGELAVGRAMTCTLSADHRAIDGVTGAELLAEFRNLIEEPLLLVL